MFADKWIAALTKPKETFAAEKANATAVEGAKHVALAYGALGLFGAIINLVLEEAAGVALPARMPRIGVVGLIVLPVFNVIAAVLLTTFGTGVLWVIAKLLGGKGSFAQQYYLSALYLAPFAVINLLTNIFGIFSPLLALLVNLLTFIYGLYLLTLVLKEAHEFSTLRAVAAWLILVVFVVVLLHLVFGTLVLSLLKLSVMAASKP